MAERWITDASPLIVLAKVGRADLLLEIPDTLLIPDAVAEEVLRGGPEDPARRLLESGFAERRSAPVPQRLWEWGRMGRIESAVSVFRALLDQGFRIEPITLRRVAEELGETW